MAFLHDYSNSQLDHGTPQYHLPDEEIYWFFNEYMRRADAYILSQRTIDQTVMTSEINIAWILRSSYNEETFAKLGYPFFGDKPVKYCGNALKQYYEDRLGIQELKVVLPFIK